MYGLSTYATNSYSGYLFDNQKTVVANLLIAPAVLFGFGPVVGVHNPPAASGRIVGRTIISGNLTGGTYVPPPIPGGTVGSTGLRADVVGTSGASAIISGGRAVIALNGVRINGRTNIRAVVTGGSTKPITYLFGSPVVARTSTYGAMDGGQEAVFIRGSTALVATLTGGRTSSAVALQGYPIIMHNQITGVVGGGRAVIPLNGLLFGSSAISGKMNQGTTSPSIVHLAARVYTQPVVTGNITGGHSVTPPPTDTGGSTGGKAVFSGSLIMKPVVSFTVDSTKITVLPQEGVPGGPSDLPTGVDSGKISNNPKIELLESVGFGVNGPASEILVPSANKIYLNGQDVHSPDDPSIFPLLANNDGSPTYSYERWLRVRFVPPFGLIGPFRFWENTMQIPPGWQIFWGWADSYAVPTNSPSQIATSALPSTDPGSQMPNLGLTGAVSGTSVRYTPYIVIQAFFVPELTQEQDFLEPLPGLTFNVAYMQS